MRSADGQDHGEPAEEPRQPMLMPDKNPPRTLGGLLTRATRELGYARAEEVWHDLGAKLAPTASQIELAQAWELLRQKGPKRAMATGG